MATRISTKPKNQTITFPQVKWSFFAWIKSILSNFGGSDNGPVNHLRIQRQINKAQSQIYNQFLWK